MTGNIYPIMRRLLNGDISILEAKEKFVTMDWRLAKRQLTWLKRNSYIEWLSLDEARNHLNEQLETWRKS